MKKVANFFKDARAIWAGFLMILSASVWGGNQIWLQKADYREDQKIAVIKQINREIAELQIQLLYIHDGQKKAMINAIMINKKTQIKNIKGE